MVIFDHRWVRSMTEATKFLTIARKNPNKKKKKITEKNTPHISLLQEIEEKPNFFHAVIYTG